MKATLVNRVHSTIDPANDHPYLNGAWTPLMEEWDAEDLSVEGSLPRDLDGVYLRNASSAMGQTIFSPETVFDFYPPTYRIPGSTLLAPQFGIDNAATALARANFVASVIMQAGAAPDPTVTGSTGTTVKLTAVANLNNVPAEVAELNQLLMHGSLSSAASSVIATAASQASNTPTAAAATAAYLILTSGQYQVER